MARLYAAADARGRIGFFADRNVGERIVFASGAADWLRDKVTALAAHDGDDLIVPGVSEAASPAAAIRALARFTDTVGGRL